MIFLSQFIFIIALGYYVVTNLQWYSYKLQRVIFHHHKIKWHLIYFVLPVLIFYITPLALFVLIMPLYILMLFLWKKKLDKPLVWTDRIKRFFAILVFVTFILMLLCSLHKNCYTVGIFIPLLLSLFISNILEKIFFLSYKAKAKDKLKQYSDLKIIAITASYGKTSIKNFLYEVLSKKYKCYKTPRSVNTIGGIVKDINEDIELNNLDFYIVEAGARESGDIDEIATFINPHYAIIGQVGEQHIEYFKTLDNIIYTKMEILNSNRLKKGFVHKSVPILDYDNIVKFPNKLNIISSTLDGLKFEFEVDNRMYEFETKLLGRFNAINLSVVILLAYELGFNIDEIKEAILSIEQVEHRLYKIEANGKIIIDDSFNGNFEGMSEAVRLCKEVNIDGDKIILTPGIVESTKEDNEKLAKLINDSFDKVVVTSELNLEIFKNIIDKNKLVVLLDKSKMQDYLGNNSKSGDLILFANDAPSFI